MSSTSSDTVKSLTEEEADVNRKLQSYGIFSAFKAGKAPSNEQIDIALNSFRGSKHIATPSKKLSAEGQSIVADFADVVQQAQMLLFSKNDGELLQEFIWQSKQIVDGNATVLGATVKKEEAKKHGKEASEGLRTLGTLLISNGQFRKLLNDATILFRDIAGDATAEVADRVRPNADQLNQIDDPADANTWLMTTAISAANIKKQLRNLAQTKSPADQGDLWTARGGAQSQDSDAQASAIQGASTLKDWTVAGIPEDKKQKGHETRARTKMYLEGKMPEERREQTIWRLKKLVAEIQGHADYQQAIDTLLDLAETYGGYAITAVQQGSQQVQGPHTDNPLKQAALNLKTLIERFAQFTSMNDLFDSINAIYKDADRDPELKTWFKDVGDFIRKVLKERGYIMEDQATDEWKDLFDQGSLLLRERYRKETDRVVDEIKFFAGQLEEDEGNKMFAQSVGKLFNDLGNDEDGKPTFKPHLFKDLSEVILPATFKNIRYVPIPRIEYTDPTMDAVIENLVIESENLMPDVFEFANDNYFRWGRKSVANENHNSATLSVSGVQMELKDVSYYIKKKQGFPRLTDAGVANIFLGGSGLSFKVKFSTADKEDHQNFFKVDKVDVNVKNFKIKLQKSKYKVPFTVFKPLILRVIRPALQGALEKVIKEKVHELDTLLFEIKEEADRTEKLLKNHPEYAPNGYSRYIKAAMKKILQGKRKAAAVIADKKVNVTVTKKDSIFPNIHLPGGISSKATQYKELALKGERWESPVFKIGSAPKSLVIPGATQIRRKEHTVNQGGVGGGQNVGNSEMQTVNYERYTNGATQTNGHANRSGKAIDRTFSKDSATIPTNGHTSGFGLDLIRNSSEGSTIVTTNGHTNGFGRDFYRTSSDDTITKAKTKSL